MVNKLSYQHKNNYYVTEFWKTNQIVTLGLFRFIGPANSYIHTLHNTVPLPSLVNWSAFLELRSFADPVNSQLRQWDPWKGAT